MVFSALLLAVCTGMHSPLYFITFFTIWKSVFMWMSRWCLSHIKFDIIHFTIFLRVILILYSAGSNVKSASAPFWYNLGIYMQAAPPAGWNINFQMFVLEHCVLQLKCTLSIEVS